jgi:glycosyltransferase involved in cell wall biosynthesis
MARPLSLIIPVYRNEENLPALLSALDRLSEELGGRLEVVFVVDGSPDASWAKLHQALPGRSFNSQLCLLSRNFGSFAAIHAGLGEARGDYFAVMAADLQEPPGLIVEFFRVLTTEPIDVAIGVRTGRADPFLTRWSARIFWGLYRRLVQRDMPSGGVDVFACNRAFRDQLLALGESNSSLVGLILWLGYRRKLVPYQRAERQGGRSAWTLRKKLRYLLDSVFAFSDLPIRLLIGLGVLGMASSVLLATVVLIARLGGYTNVPGYTATVLSIFFFAGLNSLGLGIIGSYVWRAFENTKSRPSSVTILKEAFGSDGS